MRALLATVCFVVSVNAEPDLVLRNGLIYDGSGRAPFKGDVAIKDGRIIAVGNVAHAGAPGKVIDVNGLAVGSCMIAYAAAREHNRPGAVATTTAVVNITGAGIGGALQPIIGWMLDSKWDGRMESGARVYSVEAYEAAFLTICAVCACSVLIALMVRETYCRQVRVAA